MEALSDDSSGQVMNVQGVTDDDDVLELLLAMEDMWQLVHQPCASE